MDGMETYSDVSKCVSQTASDFSFHPLSQPPVHDINDIVRFTLHYLWHLTLSRLYPASLPPSLTHSLIPIQFAFVSRSYEMRSRGDIRRAKGRKEGRKDRRKEGASSRVPACLHVCLPACPPTSTSVDGSDMISD